MSQILLAHDPPARMETVLEKSSSEMQKHYAADSKGARSLVEIGETKRDASIPDAELAAWTMVASEMLNLDETVNK